MEMKSMKERKLFGCASATSGSFKSGRRAGHGLDNPAWVFAAVVGTCIWASRPCDGQIEVSAYISNSGSNSVSVIDTETNTVVGAPIKVGSFPGGIAVTPDGKFAYVANEDDDAVSVINAATNTVIGSSIMVGSGPFGVAVTPDGKFVYVTNQLDNTVSVIDTALKQVVATINVGISPVGVAITPDGKFAYVANYGSDTVSVINTATKTVVVSGISVGHSPFPFGFFVGPNIIVAQGGPLLITNDAALSALGFGQFVDFNGGTLRTTGNLVLK